MPDRRIEEAVVEKDWVERTRDVGEHGADPQT